MKPDPAYPYLPTAGNKRLLSKKWVPFQQPAVWGFPELEAASRLIIEMEIIEFYIKFVCVFDLIATFGGSATVWLMHCEKYRLLFILKPLPAGLLCVPFSCIAGQNE